MDAVKALERLCQEHAVNFSMRLLTDGSFEIRYGDYLQIDQVDYAETFDEAVAMLIKHARIRRPRLVG